MLNHKHFDNSIAFEVKYKHSAEWDNSIWRKVLIWSWRFVSTWHCDLILSSVKKPKNVVWWWQVPKNKEGNCLQETAFVWLCCPPGFSYGVSTDLNCSI